LVGLPNRPEKGRDTRATRPPLTFAGVFTESAIEGMKRSLGESGAKSIAFRLMLSPMPTDSQVLHTKLESIFGKSGTKRIEQVIISELYLRLSMPYKAEDPINNLIFDFGKCMTYASCSFNQKHA